jgi:hypothetical protein
VPAVMDTGPWSRTDGRSRRRRLRERPRAAERWSGRAGEPDRRWSSATSGFTASTPTSTRFCFTEAAGRVSSWGSTGNPAGLPVLQLR